jgi:hypothetical protein
VVRPAAIEVPDCLSRTAPAPPRQELLTWRNASDLRDLVAFDHTLRPECAPSERVTDLLVTNNSGNHHGIIQYLGNPQAGGQIQRILSHLARRQTG